jgi:transposase
MTLREGSSPGVVAGIDAAIVAAHHVAIRDGDRLVQFKVQPTLAGMAGLTERLRPFAGAVVTAEPTAGTWLPLGAAVTAAGCRFQLVEARATAKLRQALAGKNKTDRIDALMLADAGRLFDIPAQPIPTAGLIAIRRAVLRRHRATVDAHRAECRLWALASWAFPDVWRACQGHTLAQPILDRWPDLRSLGHAHVGSITEIVAKYSKSPNPARRADKIREAAGGWALFWMGRLDLDALAWEVGQMLDDIEIADRNQRAATTQALTLRAVHHGTTDVLMSIPGIGEIVATVTRGWFTGPGQFPSAKHAAAFVGLDPSRRESGLTASRSRRITKEGPPALRLAYYQAANVARRHDPQLAEHYRRLMVERNHNHISACCAVARKLVTRAWAIIETGKPYEIHDVDGRPLTPADATRRAGELAVPEDVRRRRRAHQQRSRLDID